MQAPRRSSARRAGARVQLDPVRVVRRVARPVGWVVLGLAAAIYLCAGVGLAMWAVGFWRPEVDGGSITSLAVSGTVTLLSGLWLRAWGEDLAEQHVTQRDAVVIVALVWLLSGIFGGLPYVLGAGMSPVDAFFEAISGFTTTGATVLERIEMTISRPLLLWRSLTQWLGGMGIIVLFVAIFPSLGAGGRALFRAEVPGPAPDMLRPRITETAFYLWVTYLAMTVILFALLLGVARAVGAADFDWFEALNHTFTTVASGGFSTSDASIAQWDSAAIEMVILVFMLLTAVNFGLYYGAFRSRRLSVITTSVEFQVYLGLFVVVALALTFLNLDLHNDHLLVSLRRSFFTAASFVTSTGFAVEDYMLFSPPALMLVIFLMHVGGSAGSTAGGIKVARVVVVVKALCAEIHRSVRPNVVHVVRLGRTPQPKDTLLQVMAFILIFFGCLGAGTFVVTVLEQVSAGTAFGAMLSCLANMGPAPFHAGSDTFAAYGAVTKLVFSLAMVLGRLEFLTLLALTLPDVWKS